MARRGWLAISWHGCLFGAGALILGASAQARSLRDISPVQVYPVSIDEPAAPTDLPSDGAVQQYDSVADDAPDGLPLSFYPQAGDVSVWRAPIAARMRPRKRWTWTPVPDAGHTAFQAWNKNTKSWSYRSDDGLDLALGQSSFDAPVLGNTAVLSGVSLSQSSWGGPDDYGPWRYMVSFGVLDNTPTVTSGDLKYGSSAGRSVLQYGLGGQTVLESQFEAAPGMTAAGFGGQYDTQGLGLVNAGVSRASNALSNGWRYRAAYEVDLLDSLRLSWQTERLTDGYVDLGNYQKSGAGLATTAHTWAATVPLGRWGDVSGVFERSRNVQGVTRRRVGFSQQFWYSPHLQIGLKADRDLLRDDYDIGVRFSVPFN